jgi:hypothetical protein
MPKKTDFDKVKDLLNKFDIPFERFSPDGICPSIAIHFDDDGKGRRLYEKQNRCHPKSVVG